MESNDESTWRKDYIAVAAWFAFFALIFYRVDMPVCANVLLSTLRCLSFPILDTSLFPSSPDPYVKKELFCWTKMLGF